MTAVYNFSQLSWWAKPVSVIQSWALVILITQNNFDKKVSTLPKVLLPFYVTDNISKSQISFKNKDIHVLQKYEIVLDSGSARYIL